MQIGYCTNVHAGHDLNTTREQLSKHALSVKQIFRPHEQMGIGLWLSARSAEGLLDGDELDDFAAWLSEHQLVPFTLNGFPFGNFHQEVVKQDVYKPTWADPDRLAFTRNLIQIHDCLLPKGEVGSISTLPLMWGKPEPEPEQMERCAEQLLAVARLLHELESDQGRLIFLCIEPEPGCVLQTSHELVAFFERYLFELAKDDFDVARYLRVCHDVCHAAVMFETQEDCIQRYSKAGIQVGKVQVSSAVCVDWEKLHRKQLREPALAQLAEFAEDRYLHQLVVDTGGRSAPTFYEDLPQAIEAHGHDPRGEWRVHFHVPVYLESFGHLSTSRDEIVSCLHTLKSFSDVTHFEVETYAWDVLPGHLRQARLADGIAQELLWFEDLVRL